MKKLTIILLFTNLFCYGQIDYKGLIRNLEEVTSQTNVKEFFKDLPIKESIFGDITFNDERFLRFHGVIVDKVNFSDGWSGKTMTITPFDEAEDFIKIKTKLIELYGEPETNESTSRVSYEWETESLYIMLKIEREEREEEDSDTKPKFKSFDEFYITFK